MNAEDKQEVNDRVKLGVESYFNHYLTEVQPKILDRWLSAHDHNCKAHGAVAKRLDRYRWWLIGAGATFGAILTGLKLIAAI